jgi:hypothetical protein
MRWKVHVARKGQIGNAYKADHLEDLVVDGRIILKRIIKK